jgi:Tetratricopeptide repeat
LQKTNHDELELAAKLAKALPRGHQASIAATLRRSIRRLGPLGSDVLRLAAALAAAPLPLGLIAPILQHADGLDDPAAREQAALGVDQAENLSLASPTGLDANPKVSEEPPVEGGWVVHALVARTMRFTDSRPKRTAALRAAAVSVLTQALQAIVDARAHVTVQAMVPHARELARHPSTVTEADLLGWVARYDYQRGDFRPAEQGWRQQWDTCRQLLGANHPDTLTSMNNLAATLYALGDLAGARDLQQQARDAQQRRLGADHPTTLRSMNNLASTLADLGDLAGARQLHQQVLDAFQRVLGPDHPTTRKAADNLASVVQAQAEAAPPGRAPS